MILTARNKSQGVYSVKTHMKLALNRYEKKKKSVRQCHVMEINLRQWKESVKYEAKAPANSIRSVRCGLCNPFGRIDAKRTKASPSWQRQTPVGAESRVGWYGRGPGGQDRPVGG